jgi:hypothetical protein
MNAVVPVNLAAIPADLRSRRQWVAWRSERRDGKPTKVPYCVETGKRASSTDPQTWTTFETALAFAQRHADGVGFVFTPDDPYCGVDLDNCIAVGELHPDADVIVRRLDTYSEFSVSGHGAHVIGRGNLNGFKRNRTGNTPWGGEFEVYDQGRFFCVTGDALPGTPRSTTDFEEELGHVLAQLFPPAAKGGPPADIRASGRTDAEVLERAFAARNGTNVQALYRGDVDDYGSRSEADLALCSQLGFWTGPDPDQLARLFRGSGLMRPKWERPDYRDATIAKALEGAEFFDWGKGWLTPKPTRPTSVVTGWSGEGWSGGGGPRKGSPPNQPLPPVDTAGESEASDQLDPPPFAQPVDQFIAERSDSPVALIGDESEAILPTAGLMLLVAKGGKGKTTATVELALHLASGVDWLGFTVAQPLRVLFIENEGPPEPFRAKLEAKRKLWDHDIRGELFIHTADWGAFSLAAEEHAAALRTFVEEHDIDLVVGDPLDSLGVDGVGSPEDTRRFMELMSRVGLFRDVAFVLLHHPRKEGAAEEIDEAGGAWGGKPDTMLRLERKEANRARLSFPKVRWSRRGTRPAYILAFDPETESFSVAHEEEDEERDYLSEVEELLADRRWRTLTEIAAPAADGGIGASAKAIRSLLEASPDRFASRSGTAAKAVGRHASATVWQLAQPGTEPAQTEMA